MIDVKQVIERFRSSSDLKVDQHGPYKSRADHGRWFQATNSFGSIKVSVSHCADELAIAQVLADILDLRSRETKTRSYITRGGRMGVETTIRGENHWYMVSIS